MHVCSLAWLLPVTWQRWSHSSRPCCGQTSRLYLLQNRSHCRSKFYIARIGVIALFAPVVTLTLIDDPIIFIYELDPYSLKMYTQIKSELSTLRLSKVIVWHSCRHTYVQTDRETATKTITRILAGGRQCKDGWLQNTEQVRYTEKILAVYYVYII